MVYIIEKNVMNNRQLPCVTITFKAHFNTLKVLVKSSLTFAKRINKTQLALSDFKDICTCGNAAFLPLHRCGQKAHAQNKRSIAYRQ